VSGGQRDRSERGAAILPLTLHSHAVDSEIMCTLVLAILCCKFYISMLKADVMQTWTSVYFHLYFNFEDVYTPENLAQD